jgi:long-subunit acyl-CoA synthetase (AMP-forming)
MNKTQTASDFKALWLQADQERQRFFAKHTGAWTPEADETYRELRDRAENLFYAWSAVASRKSTQQVAYEAGESMQSWLD